MDWIERLLASVNDNNIEETTKLLNDNAKDKVIITNKSPLFPAVDNNNIQMVELLLGYNIQGDRDQPKLILHSTVRDNVDVNILEALVNSGLDVNEKDRRGQSALHLAAKYNLVDKLELLLQAPALNVNAVDHTGRNALHHLIEATRFEDIDEFTRCATLLLERGADINLQDKMNETPLHKVCSSHNEFIPNIISHFLQKAQNVNHEIQDLNGQTIFHLIVSNINEVLEEDEEFDKIVEDRDTLIRNFLTRKIVDICPHVLQRLLNQPDRNGESAFQTYIESDYSVDIIHTMIELGADVNQANNLGITPLMQAVLRERDDVVDLLVASGADCNKADIFGQTAVFRTRTEHSFDVLCKSDAQFNVIDIFGRSPIFHRNLYTPVDTPSFGLTINTDYAVTRSLAPLFFQKGMDVNSTDRYGSTLLHYAAWHSDLNMIRILLDNGADKEKMDRNGYTPYDLAVHHGNFETFSLLQTKSKDTSKPNIDSFKRLSDYIRFIIHHQAVNNMKRALQLVGVKDNAEDLLRDLLNSPRMGRSKKFSESSELKNGISDLMNKIACTVSELDRRFQCKIFPTGSSAEGSQVGDPTEMDFVFCLTYIEEQCEVIQTNEILNTGFVHLRLKNYHNSHPLVAFANDDNILNASLVRTRFLDLITSAVNQRDIWSSEHIYFDGLLNFPQDKPIVNLQIEWFGAITKSIMISIDIVPAVHKMNWVPKDIDFKSMDLCTERIKEAGYFLLFHIPEIHSSSSDNYVRISSAPMEIEILKTIPEIFVESYSLSKMLKSLYFCPVVQFSDDEDESEDGGEINNDSDEEKEMKNENDPTSSASKFGNICHQNKNNEQLLAVKINEDLMAPDEKKMNDSLVIKQGKGWVALMYQNSIKKIYQPKGNDPKYLDEFFAKVSKYPTTKVLQDHEPCLQTTTCLLKENSVVNNKLLKRSDGNAEDTDHARIYNKNVNIEKIETRYVIKEKDINSLFDLLNEGINDSGDDGLVGGPVVMAKDEISSYMLKNCLFYTIIKIRQENVSDLSHLKLTTMLYERLLKSAKVKALQAYFMPFIDIFSYVNTNIRMIPPHKADKHLTIHCARIETFCKVILGILAQK